MSMMGLAARPGTEVLPTCSMVMMGTFARAARSSALIRTKCSAHRGSWSSTAIRKTMLSEVEGAGADEDM